MAKFKHIVQVHPVELGRPNLHKVRLEKEFDTAVEAQAYIDRFNKTAFKVANQEIVCAVYNGKVNVVTGELE
jgi:hypothetical protein